MERIERLEILEQNGKARQTLSSKGVKKKKGENKEPPSHLRGVPGWELVTGEKKYVNKRPATASEEKRRRGMGRAIRMVGARRLHQKSH